MSNMKISRRDLILVAILGMVVIGVVYYMAFYTPLQKELTDVRSQITQLEDQKLETDAKIAKMDKMQKELDEIFSRPADEITEIAPYDNAKAVMDFLNGILAQSEEYRLSSPEPKTDGTDGMVRREVTLTFSCKNYDTAKTILKSLAGWNYRCLLGNVSLNGEDSNNGIAGENISVTASMTFFESTKLN